MSDVPTKSEVIFQSAKYSVCIIKKLGLVVQVRPRDTGKLMPHTHPQYQSYVDAIKNAFDVDDANAICKAFLI